MSGNDAGRARRHRQWGLSRPRLLQLRRVGLATALLAAACHHAPTAAPTAEPTPSSSPSATPFAAQPFQPSIWPFATRADLAAWRADPGSIPWATDRLVVARHYAADVLHLRDVAVRPHCGRACQDVDVLVGGRIVSDFVMQAEADKQPWAWSVSEATAPGLEQGGLQTDGDPLVVSGNVSRPTDLKLQLIARDGKELSAATTRTRNTWMVALASPDTGLATLVTERIDARGISGIDLREVELVPATRGVVSCGRTRLVVQAPYQLDYGYTGDDSFGFTIANVGDADCTLTGYAALSLRDPHGRLPFVVRRGGRLYYRDPGAHPVVLTPHGVAVIAVEKYRCDNGVDRSSSHVRVTLPGLPPVSLGARVDYCKPGPRDPGNLLTMTAVAGSLSDIYRSPP